MAVSTYILTPTKTTKRIPTIDIIRGIAVLGMLMMMIQSFAMPQSALINPSSFENLTGNDLYVWMVSHVFADQKFLAIFSMLFGASIVMLSQKARKEHLRSTDLQYRRFVFLGIIGLVHAYFLWYHDVLILFAICGFLTFIFRSRKTKAQFTAGVIFLVVGSAISLALGYSVDLWEPGEFERVKSTIWSPNSDVINDQVEAYRSTWERQLLIRGAQAFDFQTTEFVLRHFWKIAGMMLIGMGFYKRRVFKGKQSKKYYYKMISYGIGLGLPMVVLGMLIDFNYEWDFRMSFFYTSQLNYWGSVLMSIGYIGIIVLFCKTGTTGYIAKSLAAVGRMSLTNYILMSLICSIIFYGHGFSLYGDLDRAAQGVFVLAIWIVVIAFSLIWQSYFRYGPMEWIWRSLTYGKSQPLGKD